MATDDTLIVSLPPDADQMPVELLLSAARSPAKRFVLVQSGGGAGSFARTLHLERPHVATCVVTVPAGDPHVRLDYVFTPRPFADRVVRCDVVSHPLSKEASDHHAVVADLATAV